MEIQVKVVPRAKQNKVKKDGQIYKVYLTAPPVDNKANQLLLEVLAEFFDVPKGKVSIIRGHSSRQKLIRIGQI